MSSPDDAGYTDRMREAAQLVTADRVAVWMDEFHVLHLRVDGDEYEDVRPAKAFPISGKGDYVSFLNDEDKEVALLANPRDLDDDSRSTVEGALAANYFAPKIIQIHSIEETWGITHWQVLTDCGHATFEVNDRERIRKLPKGRLIIVDADENRYEVDDVSKLDPRSQMLIQSET